jgi:hypothetical protein
VKASGVEVRADKFPRPLSAEHTLACAVGAGTLPSDAATTADIPLGFKRRILLVGEALQRFTALVSVDVNAWALGESATAPLTAQVPPIALVRAGVRVCRAVPCGPQPCASTGRASRSRGGAEEGKEASVRRALEAGGNGRVLAASVAVPGRDGSYRFAVLQCTLDADC